LNLPDEITDVEAAAILGGSLQLRFLTIYLILNTVKRLVVVFGASVTLVPSPTSVARYILPEAGHRVDFTVIAKRAGCGEIT
jgi:hypothetical protein